MITENKNLFNVQQLQTDLSRLVGTESANQVGELLDYYQKCHAASAILGTRLENLDEEYQTQHWHNPIHHLESRIKSPKSLINKMRKKQLAPTIKSVQEQIFDIAGLRVVTNYPDDVFTIEEELDKQTDLEIIRRKDYIHHPKASGYRSLHLVLLVPVYQTSGSVRLPVEIQLRTMGMDMWASLEHKLRYKTRTPEDKIDQYVTTLQTYAADIAQIETNLQNISQDLNQYTD
ncbi:GTP pyrophosphokinase family protein [Lactobacillus sp. DCY120]|uniref:GTP pyrophosphokinase family protein n=1 Tax=Bombilactobacillus apium TaxID=2675299 RepID=A0A850RCJ4_9LACO|nr:GTP pyrophosphokinase family protein [Bombilactobacillus apium]NVY97016.1 GTP pyrophosphokinase family protein [Bombilactobacillus apium]